MFARTLARVETHAVEVTLLACCAWAAKCLSIRPSNMSGAFADYYRLMGHIEHDERFWAGMAASAAASLLVGLGLSRSHLLEFVSVAMRIAGLAIAGCFLNVLGASWLAASRDSLAAGFALVLGCSAWGALWRFAKSAGDR